MDDPDTVDLDDPTITPLEWVYRGVRLDAETSASKLPRWDLPEKIAIKADIGHEFTAPQVVDEAVQSIDAGACAVHLHIQDEQGAETGEIEVWRDVVQSIRNEHPDVVIDSAPRGDTYDDQIQHLREGLFDVVGIIPFLDPTYNATILEEVYASGAVPEIIVRHSGDVQLAHQFLIDDGPIETPCSWLLNPSALYLSMPMPSPDFMVDGFQFMKDLIRSIDPHGTIFVASAGRPSVYLVALGMLFGCHARPGMGETHWRYPHRDELIGSNKTAIRDTVSIARSLGREPATRAEYRELIGL